MEALEKYKPVDAIFLGESFNFAESVLAHSALQIVCHPDVQDTGSTGQQIDVERPISQKQVPRLTLGMTVKE